MAKQLKSLVVISQERLTRNLDAIGDVGDIPYYLLKDTLRYATPDQLGRIEDINPFLMAESDELWLRHCLCFSDLRETYHRGELQDTTSWRALYIKRYEENEEKKRIASENIRKQYEKIQSEKAARSIKVLNRVVPPGRSYGAARKSGPSKLFREALKATARTRAIYRNPRRTMTTQPTQPTNTTFKEIYKPSALSSAYQSLRTKYSLPTRPASSPLIPPPPRLLPPRPLPADKHSLVTYPESEAHVARQRAESTKEKPNENPKPTTSDRRISKSKKFL